MKRASTVLALTLLLGGCGGHDSEFTRQIPGAWTQELKGYTNTLTVMPDGSFAFCRFTTNRETTFTNTGVWRIKDNVFVLTSTNRIGDRSLSLGEIFRAK